MTDTSTCTFLQMFISVYLIFIVFWVNLVFPLSLKCMYLHCGSKLVPQEKTHTDTGRTTQPQNRNKVEVFL